ncbi:ROK family protein [Lactococcus ileimucosae]|uniref:fructokinase n=1 Tax=Lactococcus ileimucosae TaxID=2941329 RepID=A0ABV4D6V0_9LACT
MKLLGSIEAGGTKFVCSVANFDFEIIKSIQLPTTSPEETLTAVIKFFEKYELTALAVGSFGPIDIQEDSERYGFITSTPKLGWKNTDIVGPLKSALKVPVVWTTDVNSSAYGEKMFGNGQGTHSIVYFTIGTGIGGGSVQGNQFIGGISHAEMGHAIVERHEKDRDFLGVCPFHGNRCLEGLASGPSIKARTGRSGEDLPVDHEVFDLIAYYAGQIAYNTYVNLAPERIIFGGSVLQSIDMTKVRKYFNEFNNGYVQTPDLDDLIQISGVADNGSATFGNFALALEALKK